MTIKDLYPTSRPSLDLNFALTKRLDPRVTFSRASSGTYFDANGVLQTAATNVARFDHGPSTGESLGLLVEEERTNSWTYSDRFDDAAWTKTNVVATPNTLLAPDGNFTAELLSSQAAGTATVNRTFTRNNPAFSVFIKAGSSSTANVKIQSDVAGRNVSYNVNLSTGVLTAGTGNTGSISDWTEYKSITSVGNGWYRIFIGFVSSSTTVNSTYSISPSSNGSAAAANESVYIWGAQLEAGTFPTSYIPTPATFTSRASTATYYDASGVVQTAGIDVARSAAYFPDSNGVMKPAGLLLEAAGTNSMIRSEDFGNASWVKTSSSVTTDTVIAPDGATTADTLTSAGGLSIRQNSSGSFTSPIFSVYLKPGTISSVVVMFGTSVSLKATFNLSTKTFSAVGSSITGTGYELLPSGWIRVWIRQGAYTFTGANGPGVEASAAGDFYAWGAQLEDSFFPTSYIPTTSSTVARSADVSSSATVTRSADLAQMTGTNFSSWYRQDEGTIYCRSQSAKNSGNGYGPYVISDNTPNNRIMQAANTTGTSVKLIVVNGAAEQASLQAFGSTSAGVLYATSFAYKANSFAGSGNGGAAVTDATGSVPSVNRLDLGFFYPGSASSNTLNGTISRLAYYPTRLTDAQLQALTAS